MNVYDVYVGGVLFSTSRKSISESHLREEVKEQIENLHPLNMHEDNLEAYRNRFRNKPIVIIYKYKN